MEPRDLGLQDALVGVNVAGRPSISSRHGAGANCGFADAHVEWLPNDLSSSSLRALLTLGDKKATAIKSRRGKEEKASGVIDRR
jgi:prepilin-type processing-associated H-X9-DG protein